MEILRLDLNENRHGCSPRAREALRAAADRALAPYPDPDASQLRERLAVRHGVAPTQVLLYNGSIEALFWMCLAHRELPAVIPAPAYHGYRAIAEHLGMGIVAPEPYLPRLDPERLAAAIPAGEPRLVVLAEPNNPTGEPFPAGFLDGLVAARPRATFLVDEAYADYAGLGLPSGPPNLIVVRTFSKAHGLAALRIGYAVVPEASARRLAAHRLHYCLDAAAAAAALAALDDDDWLARTVAANARERARLAAGLAALGLEPLPSAANFILVGAPDARGVAARLHEAGIRVKTFGPGLERFVRITVGTAADTDRVLGALGAAS